MLTEKYGYRITLQKMGDKINYTPAEDRMYMIPQKLNFIPVLNEICLTYAFLLLHIRPIPSRGYNSIPTFSGVFLWSTLRLGIDV